MSASGFAEPEDEQKGRLFSLLGTLWEAVPGLSNTYMSC